MAKSRGITLLELLIAMAILSIVTVMVLTTLVSTTNFFEYTMDESYFLTRGQSALGFIYSELADVYAGDLHQEVSPTRVVVTYTATVGWNTDEPAYGAPRQFVWRSDEGVLYFVENSSSVPILSNVRGFEIRTRDESTPNEYVIYLTISKPVFYGGEVEWVTRSFVQSRRLLNKP